LARLHRAKDRPEFVLRQPVHADQQPATLPLAAGPGIDVLVELLPAAQIEIANAEIGALRDLERLAQGRQQALLDIVEDTRHIASVPVLVSRPSEDEPL